MLRSIRFKGNASLANKRITEEIIEDIALEIPEGSSKPKKIKEGIPSCTFIKPKPAVQLKRKQPLVIRKGNNCVASKANCNPIVKTANDLKTTGGLSLLCAYDDSSDSD